TTCCDPCSANRLPTRHLSRVKTARPMDGGYGFSHSRSSAWKAGYGVRVANRASRTWSKTVPPDIAEFRAFLTRAARRIAWLHAAEGAAGGLLLAMVIGVASWPTSNGLAIRIGLAIACMAAGVAIGAGLS